MPFQYPARYMHIIAYDYNFCPYDPLKHENIDVGIHDKTAFFANTSNEVRVLIKYDPTQLVGDE